MPSMNSSEIFQESAPYNLLLISSMISDFVYIDIEIPSNQTLFSLSQVAFKARLLSFLVSQAKAFFFQCLWSLSSN